MSTNEKEPAGNPQQEQSSVPVPILTPETFARKQPDPPKESPTPPEKEHPQKTISKGKLALIVSCSAVLLAGIVTVAVLSKTGAFTKEKAPASETSLTSASEKETTASSGTKATTTTTATEPQAELVTSLDQVTDEQIAIMNEAAKERIRQDVGPFSTEGMPDEVTIDELNYLGMMLEDTTRHPSADKSILVHMVYQVQVTDNTENPPLKRQYFWSVGFPEVYQDGTIETEPWMACAEVLYFDNWTGKGSFSLGTLTNQIMADNIVLGSTIDTSRLLPFEGEDPLEVKVERVTRIDQITKAMVHGLQEASQFWMREYIINQMPAGAEYEKAEYVGLAVGAGPRENMVYVVYKIYESDLNTSPPTQKTYYWYNAIEEVYVGGQISAYTSYASSFFISMDDKLDGEINSIEELREHLKRNYPTWSYEDNFDEATT